MGSPAYMSPEQCKDSADVDLRSDIYSFATIIYEMLAGRTPHLAASGTEMLVKHLTETPAPLREMNPEVPIHVESAIARALSRSRADRFDSVVEFVSALLGAAEGGQATQPSLPVSQPRFLEKTGKATKRKISGRTDTTFSRASAEVGVQADDEVPIAVARNRRWPIVALGALALGGLALLLLARPSEHIGPRTTTGASGPETTAGPLAPPTRLKRSSSFPLLSPSWSTPGRLRRPRLLPSPVRRYPRSGVPRGPQTLPLLPNHRPGPWTPPRKKMQKNNGSHTDRTVPRDLDCHCAWRVHPRVSEPGSC